jgi:hypothetical protein
MRIFECWTCGDDVSPERRALGYKLCLFCGEEYAREERSSWCIVQEYTKGNYQFVTDGSAYSAVRQTNPKNIRGDLL